MSKKCCPENACAKAAPSSELTNEQLASMSHALAHPARITIVQLLLARNSCVCGEIVAELPYAQSTVSQHLRVLKEAKLILGEIDGPHTCYCVDRDMLRLYSERIHALTLVTAG
jgi:ArsR family transcriptional regulator, arsenate/arsenite/antimonite-responsive transcriptional repressor